MSKRNNVAPWRQTGTALLLTGFQNDYCDPRGKAAAAGKDLVSIIALLSQAKQLLEQARKAGFLIIHTQHLRLEEGVSDSTEWCDLEARNGIPSDLAIETTWGAEFVPALVPRPDELVVECYRAGAMSDTRLEVLLRSAGIRRLVVAGLETQHAVLSTVVQAANLDYHVVVPTDAVASTDPILHFAALTMLAEYAVLRDGDPATIIQEEALLRGRYADHLG